MPNVKATNKHFVFIIPLKLQLELTTRTLPSQGLTLVSKLKFEDCVFLSYIFFIRSFSAK